MTEARPSIAVLVPTRGRPEMLARCLRALAEQAVPVETIVVIDQGDGDATGAVCREAQGAVIHLPDSGRGLSRARNLGLALVASADVVACIDDDCLAERGWSAAMSDVLSRHPHADGVFGEVRPVGTAEDTDGVEVSAISFVSERVHHGNVPPDDVGFGCNFALRRSGWSLLGAPPFDERLGAGTRNRAGEDMDAIHRLLRGGAVLVSAPSMRVDHHQWRSRSALPSHLHGYALGGAAFATKHLAAGDRYAGSLLRRQIGHDVRFLASGFRRRSPLRLRGGLARVAGTARGVAAGLRLGPDVRRAQGGSDTITEESAT